MSPNKLTPNPIDVNARPSLAECVRTVEIWRKARADQGVMLVVRVLKDLVQTGNYWPVVFRRTEWRLRPSFVNTLADEALDTVDPAYGRRHFTRANAQTVLDDVVAALRNAAGNRQRPSFRIVELLRTIEVGPYDCAGEAPWHFIVNTYKDLDKPRVFLPVVFRREVYRMMRRRAKATTNEQVDILVRDFEPERFRRTSARAAEAAILHHIRTKFEPGYRRRSRSA